MNDTLLASIEETIRQNKIKKIFIQSESEQGLQGITSYGGLLGTLGDLAGEKYGAAAQKILIPTVARMIRKFMIDNNIEDKSMVMGEETMPLIESVERLLASANTVSSIPNQISCDKQNRKRCTSKDGTIS